METTMPAFRAAAALPFRLSLCNEVLREHAFADQCRIAAALGYDGLEVAPFTLADDPRQVTAADVDRLRAEADAHGIAITGLHWLLVSPGGLSITDPDPDVKRETAEVIAALVRFCRDLGGSVLVHGSPQQRILPEHEPARSMARATALEHWASAGRLAAEAGVTYCVEPLAEANFVRTVAEGAAIVKEVGVPGLATMIDASAAGRAEAEPLATVLRRGLVAGDIAHVQINAVNRRAPGQGDEHLLEAVRVLVDLDYRGTVAVEPFDYQPDGLGSAAFSAGYVRGLAEGAQVRQDLRRSK